MTDKMAEEIVARSFCNKCGFVGVADKYGSHRRPKDGETCNYTATSTADAKVPAPAWTEFNYAQPVEIVRKRESAPKFPGFVIGWYQRLDGARGYVLQHDPDRIVHVNPVGSVVARVEAQPSALQERMAAAIELGHETLHQCTAVLSATDCATVAKAMLEMRQTLDAYCQANAAGEVGA